MGLSVLKSALGRKLMLIIISASTFLAIFSTGFQLWYEYDEDMNHLKHQMSNIEISYKNGIIGSLWTIDHEQVQRQIDGILALPDIRYVEIVTQGGSKISAGIPAEKDSKILKKIPLNFYDRIHDKEVLLGTMSLVAINDRIVSDLLNQTLVLLGTNMIKTFLISIVIVLIFHLYVSRHLVIIAHDLKRTREENLDEVLQLKRESNLVQDELDEVVYAINYMKSNLLAAMEINKKAKEDLVESQKELTESKKQAESANQAKSFFLANMSHEIRTPLSSISGFVDLLRDTTIGNDEKDKYLTIIKRNSHALKELVDDILDISKIESETVEVKNSWVPIQDLMDDIASLFESTVQSKNLDFQVNVSGETVEEIYIDSMLYKKVLTNIIGNAVKFTDQGFIKVDISTSKSQDSRRYKFKATVTDSGIGIAESKFEDIFSPFVQADETESRKFGGTGLGLALAERISHILGGHVKLISSEEGKGSVFEVVLCIDKVKLKDQHNALGDHMMDQSAFDQIHSNTNFEGKKILLTEDNLDTQFLVENHLNKKGAVVTTADNGKQAIDMIARDDYDLILMDIKMPVMDGISATKTLRKNNYKKPIIAFTANVMQDQIRNYMQAGFDSFIEKPIKFALLDEVIERYINTSTIS